MRRLLKHRFVLLTALLSIIFALAAPAAIAQPQGRDMQKEAEIWEDLAVISPGSVETFKQATEAMDSRDMKEAVRLYSLVRAKAPNSDSVLRRLGYSMYGAGQREEGLALLRKAIGLNRSPENLISLARLLAFPDDNTDPGLKVKGEALGLAKEANATLGSTSSVFTTGSLAESVRAQAVFRRHWPIAALRITSERQRSKKAFHT